MRKLAQRTEAVISLGALAHNIHAIRSRLKDTTQVMAVLKGDGYGHGEKGIYPTLKKCGVERYAVAVWEEGASLRKAGAVEPILLLGDTCDGSSKTLSNIISHRLFSLLIRQKSSICLQNGAELFSRYISRLIPV